MTLGDKILLYFNVLDWSTFSNLFLPHRITLREQDQQCADKVAEGEVGSAFGDWLKEKPWSVAFDSFYGVNPLTMADCKLLMD